MSLSRELQVWLAENLIAGAQPEQLRTILVNLGCPVALVDGEIAQARNHPFIEAGKKFDIKLKKRESLLKTFDFQQRHDVNYTDVRKVPLPSFADFLSDYYYANRPGIFSGGIDHWEARNWTPRKLVEKIGADANVEVQFGRDTDTKYESNSHKLKKMVRFGEFIDMVENTASNNFYLTANNAAFASGNLKSLIADTGNIGDNYLHPEQIGRATHLWIGPKGTITPLHHDLTNNLFVQVVGKKKFTLIAASQVPYMYNNLHVFSDTDLLNPQFEKYPEFQKAIPMEFEVEAGDVLFIPIGWWHHVEGLTPNISLSFTNFNVPFNGFIDYPQGPNY